MSIKCLDSCQQFVIVATVDQYLHNIKLTSLLNHICVRHLQVTLRFSRCCMDMVTKPCRKAFARGLYYM